jgi:hypothetical protein
MGFTVIVLDQNEEPLEYLDSENLEIEQTSEVGELQTLTITYPLDDEDINKTRKLFKIGNKMWIPGTNGLDPCLYVISNSTKYDYWDKNHIEIELEEVLVELNYVELFKQYSAETKTINRTLLEEQFGSYFNIGTVESALGSRGSVALNGTMTKLELLRYIEEETSNVFQTRYVKDSEKNIIHRYLDFLQPSNVGEEHDAVIDLSFNAENIEYEIDESDTYRAIAPEFSLNSNTNSSGSGSVAAEITRTDLQGIIDNWSKLAVTKGQSIPMIIEKQTSTDSNGNTTESEITTAYWAAPFSKTAGTLYIKDDVDTGVEYQEIYSHPDATTKVSTPKIGTIQTSETNPYVIYNRCANTLIDKRYPEINLDVELKDIEQVTTDNTGFSIYDRVFVKIPDYEKLIRAQVLKIVKNPQMPGETKITLGNADIGTRINQVATTIEAKSTYTITKKGQYVTAKLKNADGPLTSKYCSITVIKGSSTLTSSKTSYKTVSNTTQKVEYSYSKCGVSSDKRTIMAIGKPSAGGELNKYGYVLWRSIFKNRCPHCGHASLVWGYKWGSVFPCTGRREGGSAEGHIFCSRCDADYSCIDGKEHETGSKYRLTRVSGPVRSNESEANKLKNGKMVKITKTTTSKKVPSTTTTTSTDKGFTNAYSKKTDSNGDFSLKINLSKGEYTLKFNFGGDIENAASSKEAKLIVK